MKQLLKKYEEFLNRPIHNYVIDKYWVASDTKELFHSNLKTDYNLLEEYVEAPILYQTNKEGFRTEYEFDEVREQVDITLGCSVTFGVGMYKELIWPSLVSKATNTPVINLGIPGAGIDHGYVALLKVTDRLKIRNVYHFQPMFGREIALRDNIIDTLQINIREPNRVYEYDYFVDHVLDDGYIAFKHQRAINAIKGICTDRNIKYYNFYTFPDKTIYSVNDKDLVARDLIHPSKNVHRRIADRFLDHLDLNGYVEPIGNQSLI